MCVNVAIFYKQAETNSSDKEVMQYGWPMALGH